MPKTLAPGAANGGEGPRRFTVEEYQQLIQAGILTEEDNVELLEGYLVLQMARGVEHNFTATSLAADLRSLVPDAFVLSLRCALTLAEVSRNRISQWQGGHVHSFATAIRGQRIPRL